MSQLQEFHLKTTLKSGTSWVHVIFGCFQSCRHLLGKRFNTTYIYIKIHTTTHTYVYICLYFPTKSKLANSNLVQTNIDFSTFLNLEGICHDVRKMIVLHVFFLIGCVHFDHCNFSTDSGKLRNSYQDNKLLYIYMVIF